MSRTPRYAACAWACAFALSVALALPTIAAAVEPLEFSQDNASAHVLELCAHGPRIEGSWSERVAFDYIASQLQAQGYRVTRQRVKLPRGRRTQNLIAEKPGRSAKVVLLGAHVDTKNPAPGANDNGSGVATLLELARDLKNADTEPTVRFVFFGGEEMTDRNPNHHHYGSRAYVRSLGRSARRRIAGMVSVDMVGYGSTFNVRSMRVGPRTAVRSLQRSAASQSLSLPFLADKGRYGWSDHEPFERASIPAAWLEWRYDPTCHTRRDAPTHLDAERVATSGRFLRNWLMQMTSADLAELRR